MIERPIFLFFILNADKKALYVNSFGGVSVANDDDLTPEGIPAYLKYSPEGWGSTGVKYTRNLTYKGLVRDYTVPLTFYGDGKKILDHLYNQTGYETVAYLGVRKMDQLNLPYKYKKWYVSELNFSKYNRGERSTKIEALEGGAAKYLKANEGTAYTIDCEQHLNSKNCLFDGVIFDYSRTFFVQENQEINGVSNFYMGMVGSAREGMAPDVNFFDTYLKQSSVYPNDDYFLTSGQGGDYRIKGKVKIYFNRTTPFELRVETNDGVSSSGFPQFSLVNIAGSPRPAGTTEEFTFDEVVTLSAGWRAHMKIYGGSSPLTEFTVLSGEVIVEYEYRYQASYVKGLYAYDLAKALVDKMTGGLYQLKSDWLRDKKDLLYTSGDELRAIDSSTFKISFIDFYKSLTFAGVGVEGDKIVIEPLDYFFKNEVGYQLGEVSDAELKVAEDLVGNVIKTGYKKIDYSETNGRYEFNQGQVWTTPVLKILRDLDMISPVRADALGMEIIRTNLEKKKTTDGEGDNDTFMIHVDSTEVVNPIDSVLYHPLYRPAYSSVTGLPHWETYFNTELSPHKRILSWGKYLRSLYDKLDQKDLILASADKNKELSTTLGVVTVTENAPIRIGELGDRLFLPYYISFKTKDLVNLLADLDSNQYKLVEFTWNGLKFKGFLWDGEVRPAERDTQTWTLLSGPGNSLNLF